MDYSDFVNLHVHDWMSLLDGEANPEDLVLRAKALGQTAIAVTNHGSMASVPHFYKTCKDNGMKPIIGCEFYVCEDMSLKDSDHRTSYHLILLAKNNIGYRNLNVLLTKANLDGFYYKPRIDNKLLEQYSEGIVCLSACRGGEIPQLILQDKYDRAVTLALHYSEIFENFFLELQYDGDSDQVKVNEGLMAISQETGIPLVVTADTHYAEKEDYYSHEVLLAIQTKATMDDPNRFGFPINSYWLKSEAEIREWNPPEEAIKNTRVIADMCNVEIEFGKPKLPKFQVPLGFTSATYLQKLCEDSFYEMVAEGKIPDPVAYMERLNFELDVINPKGLSDYFLIVWDLLRYGKENGAIFGPGRGSAAGSMVAYLLKVTRLDPIEHDLLFERFLSLERVGMPDKNVA
ncbi:MAG TPA: DNA polymerase III subunit alpha [Pseudoneobacillus sp.]|nr:DNA polymerase III subunit alpha [Pseudoneobacillus sp.]